MRGALAVGAAALSASGATFAATVAAPAAAAQAGSVEANMRAARAELERLRRQRDSVAAQLRLLDASSRDMSSRVRNLETQTELTVRAVNAYNRQLQSLNDEVDSASASLVRAEDDLLLKQASMRRRIIDIYKRGPLYSFEALLSAESFGQLVTRYKYLRTIAQDDRVRVRRMEDLREQVAGKRDLLVVLHNEMAIARDEQADERQRLRTLESQLQQRLASTQRSADAARRQIQRFAADSARLANTIASIEAERRRAEARGEAPAVESRSVPASERGQLDWPVNGDVLYSFGRARNPNNTEIRWDGIGIAAPLNSPVTAVAAGVVEAVVTLGTYGLCVALRHGDDYTMYCSLSRATVGKGQSVEKGQQVGLVGVNDPDIAPHLHFEVHVKPRGARSADTRTPIDPLEWLRNR